MIAILGGYGWVAKCSDVRPSTNIIYLYINKSSSRYKTVTKLHLQHNDLIVIVTILLVYSFLRQLSKISVR